MEKKIKKPFCYQDVHWIEVCVKHGNGIEWFSDDMYQAEEYTDFDSLILTVWLHIRSYKHICPYAYRTIEESISSSHISFSVRDADTKEVYEKYTIHFQLGNCNIKTFSSYFKASEYLYNYIAELDKEKTK